LPENIKVAEAIDALNADEEILETLKTLFLVDKDERLTASVPLARLFTAAGSTPLKELGADTLIRVDVTEMQNRITELFDKYNLVTLPVVDEAGKLVGAITADEVISLLRQK